MVKNSLLTAAALTVASLFVFQACTAGLSTPEGVAEGTDADALVTITASIEDSGTKTQLMDGTKVVWTAGDHIQVFNTDTPNGAFFKLDPDCDGKSSGVFTGSIKGEGPYYAIYGGAYFYPHDTTFTVHFPTRQTYSLGSFSNKANVMVARGDDLNTLKFKNICGILCVPISGPDTVCVRQITLTSDSDEWLDLGEVPMNYGEGSPSSTCQTGNNQSHNEIILDCPDVKLSSVPTNFYFAVPAGTLGGGFTLKIEDSHGGRMFRTARASEKNRIVRSTMTTMPSIVYVPHYSVRWKSIYSFECLDTLIACNEKPVYGRPDPYRPGGVLYDLEFAGWADRDSMSIGVPDTDLPPVTSDVTYYAAFSRTDRKVHYILYDQSVATIQSGEGGKVDFTVSLAGGHYYLCFVLGFSLTELVDAGASIIKEEVLFGVNSDWRVDLGQFRDTPGDDEDVTQPGVLAASIDGGMFPSDTSVLRVTMNIPAGFVSPGTYTVYSLAKTDLYGSTDIKDPGYVKGTEKEPVLTLTVE